MKEESKLRRSALVDVCPETSPRGKTDERDRRTVRGELTAGSRPGKRWIYNQTGENKLHPRH